MKTYDALKDLDFINEQLFFYLYLVGLNPDKAESYSIDEIINCTRSMVVAPIEKVESGEYNCSEDPLYWFLKNQRISLVGNIRRIWYMKQLAAAAVNNAV